MNKKNKNKNKSGGKTPSKHSFLFNRTQYKIMIAGLLVIALGYILMAGGGSDDPEVFNEEIYNFRRIRLAPTLVLIGLGMQVWAILYKGKASGK